MIAESVAVQFRPMLTTGEEPLIYISSIRSFYRNIGNATKAMVQILSVAREAQVDVALYARPFGRWKDKLGKRQLKRWYKSLGFRDAGYDLMLWSWGGQS